MIISASTPQEKMQKVLEQQRYLDLKADVWYQCYFEKIDYPDFWQKYLWNHLNIKFKEIKT